MFKKLGISKRFSLILLIIFLFTLPTMTTVMYYKSVLKYPAALLLG